ncbi:ABC transporter substrate-binding protein [Methanospirillum stamsii]|uniref:ABC transporter substrate-binding protein n=1 Tax=Methanospirillum stamsii TaxID=1277351 RepID=A0A2V2MU60_9EURY|nr:ABC transporter substrate-binding protein [Methanospirillum stamsii]PWR69695.1 ABC transporter substrate-binding protein [Methanospirillum stamsii]
MSNSHIIRIVSLVLLLLLFISSAPVLGDQDQYPRTIIDGTGAEVTIDHAPERVFAISTGLIGTTMYIFGETDKIVGKGGCTKGPANVETNYTYNGKKYSHTTPWAVEAILYPKYLDDEALPFSGSQCQENIETIAKTNPDIIIISTRAWGRDNGEGCKKSIETMKKLGVPVVVLNEIAVYDQDETEVVYKEIELLGEIFAKEDKAQEIIDLLKEQVKFIQDRTKDIPDDEKRSFMYAGISTRCPGQGGVSFVEGVDQLESIMLENIVNAKNSYTGNGRQVMSREQMLALDPDVILLPTAQGVHTPDELYYDERFVDLQDMRAIKEKRVTGLPLIGCRTERLSFPVSLMVAAKAIYPERFGDIKVNDWVDEYHRKLYGVDDDTLQEIKKGMCLEWMADAGF